MPPFCVQFDISVSTVSATPEKYQTVVLTETPDDVFVVLQPPSAPSREQAFETTPPLFMHSFSAVVRLWDVDTFVQTSTQVWLGPVPAVHAVVVLP